jgi:hypothetical protein
MKNDRFIKIAKHGTPLPADASEWQAVLDTRTSLMWAVEISKRLTFKKAQASVGKLAIGGFEDWRLPTVEELFLLADRTRKDPAIDTDFFPDTPSDWFWTSTVYAGSPADYAWFVNFSSGSSYWDSQGYEYCVRAVRAGQS